MRREQMSDVERVVADDFAMWSEADPHRQAQLIASAWTANGRNVDPRFEARGHSAVDPLAQAAQAQFPGTSSTAPAAWTSTMTGPASAGP
jgi:hypothetical protein